MDSINGCEIGRLDLHYCMEGDESALYAWPVRERIPVSTAHTLAAMRLPSDATSEILAAPRQDAEPSSPDFGDAMCMAPFVNLAVAIGGGSSPCCLFSEPIGDVRRQSIAGVSHRSWMGSGGRGRWIPAPNWRRYSRPRLAPSPSPGFVSAYGPDCARQPHRKHLESVQRSGTRRIGRPTRPDRLLA